MLNGPTSFSFCSNFNIYEPLLLRLPALHMEAEFSPSPQIRGRI